MYIYEFIYVHIAIHVYVFDPIAGWNKILMVQGLIGLYINVKITAIFAKQFMIRKNGDYK